jgi:LRR receptor-like serine/threonine-protein kinase FLS2
LNFSFNKLSGEVPRGGVFRKLGAKAFVGNVGLCGSWVSLPPCSTNVHKSHLVSVLISVIAVTTVVVLCMFLGILWRKNHRRLATMGSLKVGHQRISYVELVTATDGFSDSNLLGVGSFGKVYKGIMKNGTYIAVKLLNLENEGANKSFERECNVLSKVRHRNLITIITSYSDLDFKALIFPFMPNGSLEKWLYPSGEEDSCALSLIQRLNIAIDIAHGMAYLHHHCFMQVIHCDLKPSNVLLGKDLTAYLIDFGIATVCFANSDDAAFTSTHLLKGSTGYIPPEYGLGGGVTTKGDVYSYGIVLLEMFTRKKPTHSIFVEEMDLKKWVNNSFPNQVEEVVDGSLLKSSNTNGSNEDKDLRCLTQLIRVGLICTQQSPQERPNMMDIVGILQSIKDTFLETTQNANSSQISYSLASTSTTGNNTAGRAGNNGNSQSSTF